MADGVMKAVILTKSAKYGGYCVAGLRAGVRDFVRFVSRDEESVGALTNRHMLCSDGTAAEPLDLVLVPVIGPAPTPRQPENWLVDPSRRWEKLGRVTLGQVCRGCPPRARGRVFGTTGTVLSEKFYPDHSLELVRVSRLTVHREAERKPKGAFICGGGRYEGMSMTDPAYYGPPGDVEVGEALIVASLPERAYNGKYFKFIAKIFPLESP